MWRYIRFNCSSNNSIDNHSNSVDLSNNSVDRYIMENVNNISDIGGNKILEIE